ncbi:MAG: hypothetical protein ACYC1L_13470 [Alphaproteobacteria bacterium]
MKAPLLALAVGLVAGPLIAASAGWTVWSGAAKAQLHASTVEQAAHYCEARVRSDVAKPGALSYDERYALATKWAAPVGSSAPDADIAQACAFRLAD